MIDDFDLPDDLDLGIDDIPVDDIVMGDDLPIPEGDVPVPDADPTVLDDGVRFGYQAIKPDGTIVSGIASQALPSGWRWV